MPGSIEFFHCIFSYLQVYAVEASDCSEHAQTLVHHNDLSDVIQVIQCRVENLDLPEQVDLIISEWMGTMLMVRSLSAE